MDQLVATVGRLSPSTADRFGFASNALILGTFFSVSVAAVFAGSVATQLLIGSLLTVGTGGLLYWGLLRLADWVLRAGQGSPTPTQRELTPGAANPQNGVRHAVDGGRRTERADSHRRE